ncbi:MAG: type 4 pilus major pilin [Gluconacetobacter sp.]
MERLIAIIAATVLGVMALGYVAKNTVLSFMQSGTETAVAQAGEIWSQARAVYGTTVGGGQTDFTPINNADAIKAGIVPQSASPDGQTIRGPWQGSTITLTGSTSTLYEDWNAVPSAACARFALSQPTNMVFVNGTGISTTSVQTGASAAVAEACNRGTTDSLSEVKFSFTELAGQ